MAVITHEMQFQGRKLIIESGKLAKQASGSVTIRYGDTMLLVTSTVSKNAKDGIDFFPLLVDYQEKFYAAGKILGSRYSKREGRPSDGAILACRMIDRPLRPMFPKRMRNDTQVVVTVLSADMVNNPEDIAITGASLACLLTGARFEKPVAGVRIGLVKKDDGSEELVVNPNYEQIAQGRLDLMVAGTEDAITMIETASKEVSSEMMIKALELAHNNIKDLCKFQNEFLKKYGEIKSIEITLDEIPEEITTEVANFLIEDKLNNIWGKNKAGVDEIVSSLEKEVLANFKEKIEDESNKIWQARHVKEVVNDRLKFFMRKRIFEKEERLDGRKLNEIRLITCEVGVIPRTHGSGLFTRGETQVLSLTTLGAPSDVQIRDEMDNNEEKRYMHHYNFPGFATGEVSPNRGVGRREIGHGDLAERALLPVLPDKAEFPYTIRVVSEVLESNGSSSMGSVCGSTLSLLDAGVPLLKPVSGIAMGLILDKTTGNYKILTDIQGTEDFLGDMDFKLAGTEKGITALQLDIKIQGLTFEILKKAIESGNEGRAVILQRMLDVMPRQRDELSKYAPRIINMKIDQSQIGDVIGPQGKVIKAIIEATGVQIDIQDDGQVLITTTDVEQGKIAQEWIKKLTYMPKVGDVFEGKVTRIMTFGAFVEIVPGKEGLVHISELAQRRVERVEDIVKVGDIIKVRLKEIDDAGRLNLTHKEFSK